MNPQDIRALRERLGWSQPVLAALVGANAVAVSRWELGHARPTHFQVQLLSAFGAGAERRAELGAEVLELFRERGPVAGLAAALHATMAT